MSSKSARTSAWASAISLLLGMVVLSPAGSFFLYGLAALAALIPITIGGWRPRIAGAVILALSLILLVATYPKFDTEMTRYKQRAQQKSSGAVQPPVPQQGQRR
jgi:membrane protein implicated in regulation of membrane protease activity